MNTTENPEHLSHNAIWRPHLGHPALRQPGLRPPPQGPALPAAPPSLSREEALRQIGPRPWPPGAQRGTVTRAAGRQTPSWQGLTSSCSKCRPGKICAFPKSRLCSQNNQMVSVKTGLFLATRVCKQTSTICCFQPAGPSSWPPAPEHRGRGTLLRNNISPLMLDASCSCPCPSRPLTSRENA